MKRLHIAFAAALIAALAATACTRAPAPTPAPSPTPQHLSATSAPSPSPARSLSASSAPPAGTSRPAGKDPALPDRLRTREDGEPIVTVYQMDKKTVEEMNIDKYLEGVLAGEMRNDWPMEALKAQAIIARTFALRFIEEKGGSKHEGADVSTDITEAQAYNAEEVNDRIKKAIADTRGQVIAHDGKLINAWFHAHSGGVTALAKEGLEYEGEDPPYITSVESEESKTAPEDNAEWTYRVPAAEFMAALKQTGLAVDRLESVELGEKGPSGRVRTLVVNGTPVSCPSLRLRIDPTKMKSSFLTNIALDKGAVVIKGKGYGHGVGLSQWGAYGMAEKGSSAEQIIAKYFKDVYIVQLW